MRENDYIVALLENPTFSAGDFQQVLGMNLENTLLLSEEDYLKSPYIRENDRFKDASGEFSQQKFDEFYKVAEDNFNDFITEDNINNYEYSMWDESRPFDAEIKNPDFSIDTVVNPNRTRVGITGLNQITPSDKSKRELALDSRIFDPETGTWSDKTINEMSLTENPWEWIKSLFSEPLIYAQYDKDTIEIDPLTGKEVQHYKGEWKVNEFGDYYAEKLGGRSLVGKLVVSATDYLTPEYSAINKYDFFDSDDLEKSMAGNIMKNVVAIAPLFTPLSPWYIGLMTTREILKTLPMAYGMITGLAGMENTDSKLANTLRAYGERLTTSSSDYAKENTFSFENFANLASEVALQWSQLKFIALAAMKAAGGEKIMTNAYRRAGELYLDKSMKALLQIDMNDVATYTKAVRAIGSRNPAEMLIKQKWMETPFGKSAIAKFVTPAEKAVLSRVKFGQDMSLAYMAIVSNTDVYDTVKEKGGTGREAALIALGSTIGMFGVDRGLHLGEVFFSSDAAKLALRETAKKNASEIATALMKNKTIPLDTHTKSGFIGLIKKGFDSGKKAMQEYGQALKEHNLGNNFKGFVGRALGEGTEEVTEELVTDIMKQLGEWAGEMGVFSQKDYGAWENMADRYIMSFLGGAMGGAMFYGVELYNNKGRKAKEFTNDIIYLIRNGKKDDLKKEIKDLRDKGQLGSTKLSARTSKDNNTFLTAENEEDTQNEHIYKSLNKIIDDLDAYLNAEGLNLDDDQLFDKMVLGDMRANMLQDYLKDTGIDKLKNASFTTKWYSDFLELANETVLAASKLLELEGKTDAEKTQEQWKRDYEEAEKKLEELRKRKEDFFGEKSLGYVRQTMFATDFDLINEYVWTNKYQFARAILGKSYDDLNEQEKSYVDERYKAMMPEQKKSIQDGYNAFVKMEEKLRPVIQNLSESSFAISQEELNEIIKQNPWRVLTYDDRLDDESDEIYQQRYQQEGEEDLAFAKRKQVREQKLRELQEKNIQDSILKLMKLPVSRTLLRAVMAYLNTTRSKFFNQLIDSAVDSIRIKDPDVYIREKRENETDEQYEKYKQSVVHPLDLATRDALKSAWKGLGMRASNNDIVKKMASVYFEQLRANKIEEVKKRFKFVDPDILYMSTLYGILLATMWDNMTDEQRLTLGLEHYNPNGVFTGFDIIKYVNALTKAAHLSNEDVEKIDPEGQIGILDFVKKARHILMDQNNKIPLEMDDIYDKVFNYYINGENFKQLQNEDKKSFNLRRDSQIADFVLHQILSEDTNELLRNAIKNGFGQNANPIGLLLLLTPLIYDSIGISDGLAHSVYELFNADPYVTVTDIGKGYSVSISQDENGNVIYNYQSHSLDKSDFTYKRDDDNRGVAIDRTVVSIKKVADNDTRLLSIRIHKDKNNRVRYYAKLNVNGLECTFRLKVTDATLLIRDADTKLKNAKEQRDLMEQSGSTTMGDYFNTVINQIKENKTLLSVDLAEAKLLTASVLTPVIRQIRSSLREDNRDIETVLEEVYLRWNSDPDNFEMSDDEEKILDQIKLDIHTASIYVRAASKGSTILSPIGHNILVNAFALRHSDVYKDYDPLPEIEGDKALFILQEAHDYETEINFWQQISGSHKSLREKRFLLAKDAITKGRLDFFKVNQKAFVIKDVDLLKGVHDVIDNPTDKPYMDVVKIENTIYRNYQNNKDKITFEQVLDALHANNLFITKNIPQANSAKLDENFDYSKYTDYDKFFYICSVLSGDPETYYKKLQKFIEDNDNLAPLTPLEYVARLLTAADEDMSLMSLALAWMMKTNNMTNYPYLKATLFCAGLGGTGKTSTEAKIIAGDGSNAWITGPQQSQIDNLKKSLPSGTCITLEELLKKMVDDDIYSDFMTDVRENKENGQYVIRSDVRGDMIKIPVLRTDRLKFREYNNGNELPKYIVIDEVTHIPAPVLLLIDEFCQKNGITVLALGDKTLNGNTIDILEIRVAYNINPEMAVAWRTPELFISLRDANRLKAGNQALLYNIIYDLTTYGSLDNLKVIMQLLLLPEGRFSQLKLHYYQDSTTLTGDKVVDTLTADDVKYLNGSIAYIGDSADDAAVVLRESGKEFEIISPINIQGREFDYVIIGKLFDNFNLDATGESADFFNMTKIVNYLKDVYTMISRSRNASIIVDSNGAIKKYFKENVRDATTSSPSFEKAVEKFRQVRSGEIKEILAYLEKDRKSNSIKKKDVTPPGTPPTKPPVEKDINEGGGNVEGTNVTVNEVWEEPKDDTVPSVEDKTDVPVMDEILHNPKMPILATGTVFRLGVHRIVVQLPKKDENGKVISGTGEYKWVGTGQKHDIGIFLTKNEEVTDASKKSELVSKLIALRNAFVSGVTYDSLGGEYKQYITQDSWDDPTYKIRISDVNDTTHLVGLTDLDDEKHGIDVDGKQYVVDLIVEFKDKDGNDVTITLGGLSNPTTLEANEEKYKTRLEGNITKKRKLLQLLKKAGKDTGELQKNIDTLKKYKDNLKSDREEYVRLLKYCILKFEENKSKGYSSISFKIDNRQVYINAFMRTHDLGKYIRLADIESARNPEGALKMSLFEARTLTVHVSLNVFIIMDANSLGCNKSLQGRACVFYTIDGALSDEDMWKTYQRQRKEHNSGNATKGEVRMLPLRNLGMSFKMMVSDYYKNLFMTSTNDQNNTKKQLPINSTTVGLLMYLQAWNFRADLLKFLDAYNLFLQTNNLNDLQIETVLDAQNTIIKKTLQSNKKATQNDILNALLSGLDSNDIDLLNRILKFNNETLKNHPRFRLGKDLNNYGVYTDELKIDPYNNPYQDYIAYKKKNKKDTTIYGHYICPTLARSYSGFMDKLFTEFLDKIVPVKITEEGKRKRITREQSKTWFKEVKKSGSFTIQFENENGLLKINLSEYDNDGNQILLSKAALIPYIMIKIAKNIDYRGYIGSASFDEKFAKKIKISASNNESDSDNEIDWLSIVKAMIINGSEDLIKFNEFYSADAKSDDTQHLGYVVVKNDEGQIIGQYDSRTDTLFNLMFHGQVVVGDDFLLNEKHKFKVGTDAFFKHGFFVSARKAQNSSSDKTAPVRATSLSKAFFGTNWLPVLPVFTISSLLNLSDEEQNEDGSGDNTVDTKITLYIKDLKSKGFDLSDLSILSEQKLQLALLDKIEEKYEAVLLNIKLNEILNIGNFFDTVVDFYINNDGTVTLKTLANILNISMNDYSQLYRYELQDENGKDISMLAITTTSGAVHVINLSSITIDKNPKLTPQVFNNSQTTDVDTVDTQTNMTIDDFFNSIVQTIESVDKDAAEYIKKDKDDIMDQLGLVNSQEQIKNEIKLSIIEYIGANNYFNNADLMKKIREQSINRKC